MDRKKVGIILERLTLGGLCIFGAIPILNANAANRTYAGIGLAIAFAFATITGLLLEEVGIRSYGAVKRTERPRLFWFQIIFQSLLAILFVFIAAS